MRLRAIVYIHVCTSIILVNQVLSIYFIYLPFQIQRNTTPMYRTPEMIDLYSNSPINEKADIWVSGGEREKEGGVKERGRRREGVEERGRRREGVKEEERRKHA